MHFGFVFVPCAKHYRWFYKMSERKKQDWDAFWAKVGKKRTRNNKAESAGLEFLTVQRLSSSVEGKCQNIHVSVHWPWFLSIAKPRSKILKKHARNTSSSPIWSVICVLVRGEPSFTETSQIDCQDRSSLPQQLRVHRQYPRYNPLTGCRKKVRWFDVTLEMDLLESTSESTRAPCIHRILDLN